MPTLTKKAIEAARAEGDRPAFLWDSELKGYGLMVLPSGVKSFVLQYRNDSGRTRRMVLGRFGALTQEEARKLAKLRLLEVAHGSDPAQQRKEKRSAQSVSELLDKYLSDHVDVHNAESTQREVRRLVDARIRPAIGNLTIASVTRSDIAKLHRAMGGTPRTANLALSILSKAFALAEMWHLRPEYSNPARRIERYEESTRERFLSADELGRLGAALQEARELGLPYVTNGEERSKHLPKADDLRAPPMPIAVAAIELLLFTGARRSEILDLEWRHVDLDAGTIALPDRKGGERRPHPVSAAVVDILKGLPHPKGAKFVLQRPSDPKLAMTASYVETAWQRIRARAGLADVRLHDLRHTVGTYASEAGSNAFTISHVLRHKNTAITQRYVNPNADPIRAVSEQVAARLSYGLAARPGTDSDAKS